MLKWWLLTLIAQAEAGAPLALTVGQMDLAGAELSNVSIIMRPQAQHWQLEATGRVRYDGIDSDWTLNCDALQLRTISRCEQWTVALAWSSVSLTGESLSVDLTSDEVSVDVGQATLSWALADTLALSGSARWSGLFRFGSILTADLNIADISFDSADGLTAAAGVAGDLSIAHSPPTLAVDWHPTAGEVLLHPLYFSMAQPLLTTRLSYDVESKYLNLAVAQAEAYSVEVTLDDHWQPQRIVGRGDLGQIKRRFLDYVLSTVGWSDLGVAGAFAVDASHTGEGWQGELTLSGVDIADGQQRARINGLDLLLRRQAEREALHLDWAQAAIHDLPIGAMKMRLSRQGETLELQDAVAVPILDGHLRIEEIAGNAEGDGIFASASLDSISMPRLAEAMGWPSMAGELTADIPSVLLSRELIAIDGQLTVDVFDGRVLLERMQLERPFGVLPAMTADVGIDNLDLQRLTGKFGFGQISGRLDGYIRNLRLLDWQPAEFEAFIEVPEDGKFDRRISQQAVENLASVSGTPYQFTQPLLSFFDSFSYRRLGLGCELRNDICTMRGVGQRDNGYFLLEGRGLPRIDIVGFSRQVNWPELVKRIMAAIETGDVRVGSVHSADDSEDGPVLLGHSARRSPDDGHPGAVSARRP